MPDHIIAEIAEQAGRHGRQVTGVLHRRFFHQGAKRVDRRVRVGGETVAACRVAVDFGNAATAPPDKVG